MQESQLGLSDIEIKMFDEVFSVLEKYKGQTREFAIQDLHSHFPISTEEVLHETHDCNSRTLMVKPVNRCMLPKMSRPTVWKVGAQGGHVPIMFCCDS